MKTSVLLIVASLIVLAIAAYASTPAQPPAQLTVPLEALPIELRQAGDRGGIYYGDLLITNNGQTVCFDDFQSATLSGWDCHDAKRERFQSGLSACLYLNYLGKSVSEASHTAAIDQPGLVEASVWVWLPPTEEQVDPSETDLNLYSELESFGVGVETDVKAKAYWVTLGWNKNDGDGAGAKSKTALLKPGKWARLTLRLDYKAKQATALLNNAPVASMPFTPTNLQPIYHMSFWGWLGNKKAN